MTRKRSTFGGYFGTLMVVAGSVIGLGNIWRFPYVAGENGGAAFILIYITVSLLISVPVMLSEFVIGRKSRRNAMRSFKKLAPRQPAWRGVGLLGIMTAFFILAFYNVIAGWSIEFLFGSVAGKYNGLDSAGLKENFDDFVNSGWRPWIWLFAYTISVAVIVGRGVTKGIEKSNKIIMPLMFFILLGMAINSFWLDGFKEGVAFLLDPDFSKITPRIVLAAVGQSFFSMSIGMGAMITYGSYMRKTENMFQVAGTVAISDVCIAILSGLAIFPAVFTFGINPTSGPELVFLTLPSIFAQMPGGYIISILFFFLLFAAAITSSMSLLEVIVSYVSEEFRIRRRTATILTAVLVTTFGSICAFSQVDGSAIRIAGMNFFDLFDKATSLYMMPIGGMLIVVFAGWIVKSGLFKRELTSDYQYGTKIIAPVVRSLVKFVIPIFILLMFLSQLGFF